MQEFHYDNDFMASTKAEPPAIPNSQWPTLVAPSGSYSLHSVHEQWIELPDGFTIGPPQRVPRRTWIGLAIICGLLALALWGFDALFAAYSSQGNQSGLYAVLICMGVFGSGAMVVTRVATIHTYRSLGPAIEYSRTDQTVCFPRANIALSRSDIASLHYVRGWFKLDSSHSRSRYRVQQLFVATRASGDLQYHMVQQSSRNQADLFRQVARALDVPLETHSLPMNQAIAITSATNV